jgi:death-on-curing family protein
VFEIGDLLLVAERLLGIDAERLKLVVNIPSVESALAAPSAGVAGQMFYEHPVQRAAILASRIMRNDPLPDGNKRTALYLMDLYLEENGYRFNASAEEIDQMFRALAARKHSEDYFIAWVCSHTTRSDD